MIFSKNILILLIFFLENNMIALFLFIIANLLLLVFWYLVLLRYQWEENLSLSEKILWSYVIWLVINFVIFFLLGWGQLGFHIVIPLYLIVGIASWFYLIKKKKISLRFWRLHLPKYSFSFKHIPLFVIAWFILFRIFFSFFEAINIPSYFDDEKGNWNLKSKIIYYDQAIWIDKNDDNTYLWWSWHKEYPLGFILYKTYITQFLWYWDDSVTALIHPLFFYFAISVIIFWLMQSWPMRIITLYMVTSIPLVSWHAGVSYFDLFIATELTLIYFLFIRFTETKNKTYLHLIVWVAVLTLNTKNEWWVLIFPSLLPILYFIIKGKVFSHLKDWWYVLIPFLLTVPHLIFRAVYHLSFNPHSKSASYWWHGEWVTLLKEYFFSGWSYNIFWYILLILLITSYKRYTVGALRYVFMSLFFLFIIILLVFLFTNNFQFLLDQTTIHRTMLLFMVPIMIYLLSVHEKEISSFFKRKA